MDKYLAASGYLPANVKPFFIALPKDRSAQTSEEWRAQIQAVDGGIKTHLRTKIDGGFDEERFAGQIGFRNLRRCVGVWAGGCTMGVRVAWGCMLFVHVLHMFIIHAYTCANIHWYTHL